jgi:hypothetical protein
MDSEEKSWDDAVLIVASARSTRDLATIIAHFTI